MSLCGNFVYKMAAPLAPEALQNIIEKKLVIPAAYDRRLLKNESRPFCFVLKSVDGVFLKVLILHVRASFYKFANIF